LTPTILEHESRPWLFANVAVPGGPLGDELFLFHAASLTDEWTSHPMNPDAPALARLGP
jgi:hypothetical protein